MDCHSGVMVVILSAAPVILSAAEGSWVVEVSDSSLRSERRSRISGQLLQNDGKECNILVCCI